ncbi:PE-PPE domain-containing protein [Mycolicibacterium austroafricanum]|uniref:PE-PPE domain-containing protein n=1 Tax=Mycolicibacterium austroafricanum TaxID=39687 RepID=UPI001CA34F6C|nr:PE-PPE domain-containing protein [Mycolicibacterium austroafricanum]QZT64966.1 PE-PPE domain-containing protein [Mycolicibacterium austroafricanum]
MASVGIALFAGLFASFGNPTAGAATVLTFTPLPHRITEALQGTMCQSPNTCTEVVYDFSLPVSVDRITTAINAATSDPTSEAEVIVFALSGGAGAAGEWMRKHAADEGAPPAEKLSFVWMGNPGRKYGGSSRRFATSPQTQYKVLDIARQYDPVADSPDDPFNLLAHLNLMAGLLSPLHIDYAEVNVDDPRNIRWTEGNTTYVLVPTDRLPLLYPLRALGLGALADSLDRPLRGIIERGYDRPPEVEAALDQLYSNPQTARSSAAPDDDDAETEAAPDAVRAADRDLVHEGLDPADDAASPADAEAGRQDPSDADDQPAISEGRDDETLTEPADVETLTEPESDGSPTEPNAANQNPDDDAAIDEGREADGASADDSADA